MIHEMKLRDLYFQKMKSGEKTIELRLNDEKRRLVKIGDYIRFTNMENFDTLLVKVKNLYPFSSFQELFSHFDSSILGISSYQEMEKYYSLLEQEKYGVLGIEIERADYEEN